MGLFDIFSNKPTPAKIGKLSKKMLNEHQQQQIRQEAIDELVNFATPEAIGALVRRLGVNFRDTIKNEQEKKYISDILVEHFGPDAIEPMLAHIRTEQKISSVIHTLRRIMPKDRLVLLLVETLNQYSADDHRTVEPRSQLVDALADYEHEDVIPALIPYLMDHDDNIRVKVMDIIDDRVQKGHERFDEVIDGLCRVLKDAYASGRITRRAAAMLSEKDTNLSKRVDELVDFVPDGYSLGTNGRMTKA
jgi:HEAT repeat protein